METLLDIRGLEKRYPNGYAALRGVNLSVSSGEFVVVLGSNGSGKSTLLRCITRMIEPSAGTINVAGNDLSRLRGRALRDARLPVAIVAQQANLVKRRSVIANVTTGTLGRHRSLTTALGLLPPRELAFALDQLHVVGLADKARQRAGTLSGGQAQRVAIGRALAQRPRILLADEPVASLDPEAAEDVLRLLHDLAKTGLAVVCVLHQPDLALRFADRIVGLRHGEITFDLAPAHIPPQLVTSLYATEAA